MRRLGLQLTKLSAKCDSDDDVTTDTTLSQSTAIYRGMQTGDLATFRRPRRQLDFTTVLYTLWWIKHGLKIRTEQNRTVDVPCVNRSRRILSSTACWSNSTSRLPLPADTHHTHSVMPGFHSNASACVGKQPIMVATASTEHSYWLALAFFCVKFSRNKRKRQPIGMLGMLGMLGMPTQALAFLAVFVYATHERQAIAFEWKPGFMLSIDTPQMLYPSTKWHYTYNT